MTQDVTQNVTQQPPLRQQYHTIFLSPHLDDAVLSCGGQIHRLTTAGQSVLIATVMAGDSPDASSGYAQELQARWALQENPAAARRAEDAEACRRLGAHPLHWPIPDCIYRGTPAGAMFYQSDEEIFGPVHPLDAGQEQTIAELLKRLPPARRVVAPLTAGNHVDHVLVRRAAERVFGSKLLLYEDYPYAEEAGALDAVLAQAGGRLQPLVQPLEPEDLQAKVQAILAYRSQLSTFWADQAELEQAVEDFAARTGGERLWRKAPAVESGD